MLCFFFSFRDLRGRMPHFRLPRFHCSSSSTASTPWLPLPQYQPNPVSTNPSHQRTQRYTHRHAHLFSLAASLRVPPLLFSSLVRRVRNQEAQEKRIEEALFDQEPSRRIEKCSLLPVRFDSVSCNCRNRDDDDAERSPLFRRHGHRGGATAMGSLALRCSNPPPPFSKSPGSLLLLSKSLTLYC